jgi:cyclopropane-fatty-acyl-phospholipid synthase
LASHGALHLPRICLKLRHWLNRNTPRGSRRNISAHYDLGNEFYSKWLDAGMSYSSAVFSSTTGTLEEAQDAKLDQVVDLMDISGHERVLEIGCGWGGLAEQILRRTNCTLTGLTLSSEQLDFTQRRLSRAGLASRADIRLQDYREVLGTFDRIVSIEMLEAVGEAFWPRYFETLRDRLRPGGVAVLQVITMDDARFGRYRRAPDFIQKHVFPGGMIPTARIVGEEATQAGLQLVAKHFFGESYARTLSEWQRRFQKSWPQIKPLGFDERFYRMWNYYLSYCEAGFLTGALDVGFYKLRREN